VITLQSIFYLIDKGEKARALALIADLLRINPSADAFYVAALLYDDVTQAIAFAQKALALNPNHTEAFSLLRSLRGTT
jgi:tetratricopeptide (TPR) repeat protein